ncbi:MAG: chorismate synthase [Rikenellaceae bacterium]|nr:chorismate synthase [Rikenellaceae bacterium]
MNTFGRIFKLSIFGESHGLQVGVVIDGCPAGIALSEQELEADLARRKSGARGTTPRKEADRPKIVSGVFQGYTTGAPLTVLFENENTRSGDYSRLALQPRPGHADWVAAQKFNGYQDYRGGGHFSGRITLGLVAAGVIAKKVLAGTTIQAKLRQIGGCSDPEGFEAVIEQVMADRDSVGGLVECVVENLPVGCGEPFFDSVESVISHAVFSIPAIKAVEFGAGFAAATLRGSENNDPIIDPSGKTATNHAGGINGGISNGNPIVFRVAVKPTPSISVPQYTLHLEKGEVEELVIQGRHDACVALRVPVVVEAVTAVALADLYLVHRARMS